MTVRPETKNAAVVIDKFLEQIDAPMASYLESCVHCAQCAQACHFFEVTNDPKYIPAYKLKPLYRTYKRHKAPFSGLMRGLGLAPEPVTEQELDEWSELIYDSCNMCGRCTVVCPMGIDIAGVIRKMREGMSAGGFAPPDLYMVADRALETGSPLGIKPRTLTHTIDLQEQQTGIPVALDKQGADYLVILSSIEVMAFPEVIGALARIFKHAGIDWTISTKAYEATNIGIQIGSRPIASELVSRIVDAAESLGVKYVISPECGHAYSALKWEGPNLIGRAYDFEVVHIVDLLDRLVAEGRIKTKGRDQRRITFHDPCQLVRRGGVVEQPRRLVRSVSDGFAEMTPNRMANYCCGGGGGVSANSRAEELRFKAFARKKAQIDGLGGVDAVVTACANCRNVLEEAIDEYEMELPVLGLTELLADYLDEADAPSARAPTAP